MIHAAAAAEPESLQITVVPATPLLERTHHHRSAPHGGGGRRSHVVQPVSLFPHLHYELATSAGTQGEGLPSQFAGFDRVLGASRVRADGSSPDSGDIIESR